jgi:peptide/nickel transport system ATP-binding protein
VAVCSEAEPALEAWEGDRRRACHVEPSTVLAGTSAAVGEPA